MAYEPIENYGIIGDLNTVALVGLNGSIDFMCFPNFDSPTVFGALLDNAKGGYFKIESTYQDVKNKQLYLPDTNVLLTRFLSEEGVGEILDFMPVAEKGPGNVLIRKVIHVRGKGRYKMKCAPRFNYARSQHTLIQHTHKVIFNGEKDFHLSLVLKSNVPLLCQDLDVEAEFELNAGQSAIFILGSEGEEILPEQIEAYVTDSLNSTLTYWEDWIELSTYKGRWQEMVHRSALALKLLISNTHGSMVAAATFGLPEEIGGVRNWDYRYTWIRDASFTLYTLIKLGYTKEAKGFMNWVEKQCEDIGHKGYLGLMYTIDGKKELTEEALLHLEGYKNSKPVRIGNDAYRQVQLDIYGELMDAVYLYNKFAEPISYDFWLALSKQMDWLLYHWQEEDEGIWEVRGGKKHFLYSRLMCWVAFDRAVKLAERRSFPYNENWKLERDKIFHSIYSEFWNEEIQSFVQYKGANTVDAAILLMPIMRIISPTDPKWLSTLSRIEKELVSDSLLFRYKNGNGAHDGVEGNEGTFSMCTFWFVECLSKSGQLQKARLFFEKMLAYANHLGLYSEQLGFKGEHLGNFPQAFTHLGLISAAINLDSQLNLFKDSGIDSK